MKLAVYVLGREVAILEQAGDFKSVMTYHAHTAPDDFVSLTMPVRTESYVWDDQLPPVLQMNLPEGYLLQVLQEQFGPHVGASPIALLSVIGRNMVSRIEIAWPVTDPAQRQRIIDECLVAYLQDGVDAWELNADGSYTRALPSNALTVLAPLSSTRYHFMHLLAFCTTLPL